MTQVEANRPVFADADVPDVVEHRPISILAVLSVVVAVLSLLALGMPLFWAIPLVGCVLSLAALWSVTYGERRPLGRKAAILSLLVCLFLLSYAPTRYVVHRQLVVQQGRQHAETWVRIFLRGEHLRAHQLTSPMRDRVTPGTDLTQVYAKPPGGEVTDPMLSALAPSLHSMLNSFLDTAVIKELAAIDPDAELRFREVKSYLGQNGQVTDAVLLRYDIEYEVDGVSQVLPVLINMERQYDPATTQIVWRMADLKRA